MVQQDRTSIENLWLRYFANGGNAGPLDFEAYIYGLLDPDEYDALILFWAVEEVSARQLVSGFTEPLSLAHAHTAKGKPGLPYGLLGALPPRRAIASRICCFVRPPLLLAEINSKVLGRLNCALPRRAATRLIERES